MNDVAKGIIQADIIEAVVGIIVVFIIFVIIELKS